MPLLFFRQMRSGIRLCVWKIGESEEALFSSLSPCLQTHYKPLLQSVRSSKRRLELLAARVAAHNVVKICGRIAYNGQGAPFIDTQECGISVSHSKDTVFAAFSGKDIGIDVQHYSDQLPKVARCFLNSGELRRIINMCRQEIRLDGSETDGAALESGRITEEGRRMLLLAWSAKEAVFKLSGERRIDLKNSVTVNTQGISRYGYATASVRRSGADGLRETAVADIRYLFAGDCVYVIAENA